jgi:hypothetical protein
VSRGVDLPWLQHAHSMPCMVNVPPCLLVLGAAAAWHVVPHAARSLGQFFGLR